MGDMIDSTPWLVRRLDPNTVQQIYEWQEGLNTSNATTQLINGLLFDQSKEIRTSTIILAAFNISAAFLTATSILYDHYCVSKQCSFGFKAKYDYQCQN